MMGDLFDSNYEEEIISALKEMKRKKENELHEEAVKFRKLREQFGTAWAEKDLYENLVLQGCDEYQTHKEAATNKYNELNQVINEEEKKTKAKREVIRKEIEAIEKICNSY